MECKNCKKLEHSKNRQRYRCPHAPGVEIMGCIENKSLKEFCSHFEPTEKYKKEKESSIRKRNWYFGKW